MKNLLRVMIFIVILIIVFLIIYMVINNNETNYLQNEQLEKLMQDIIKVDINSLSVREAYELLHQIQQQFSIIIENGGEIDGK